MYASRPRVHSQCICIDAHPSAILTSAVSPPRTIDGAVKKVTQDFYDNFKSAVILKTAVRFPAAGQVAQALS